MMVLVGHNLLKVKAWIALHGNKDCQRLELRGDCSSYSPADVRVLSLTTAIRKRRLTELDVEGAFHGRRVRLEMSTLFHHMKLRLRRSAFASAH